MSSSSPAAPSLPPPPRLPLPVPLFPPTLLSAAPPLLQSCGNERAGKPARWRRSEEEEAHGGALGKDEEEERRPPWELGAARVGKGVPDLGRAARVGRSHRGEGRRRSGTKSPWGGGRRREAQRASVGEESATGRRRRSGRRPPQGRAVRVKDGTTAEGRRWSGRGSWREKTRGRAAVGAREQTQGGRRAARWNKRGDPRWWPAGGGRRR